MTQETKIREPYYVTDKHRELCNQLHKTLEELNSAIKIRRTTYVVDTPIYPELFEAHGKIAGVVAEVETIIIELERKNKENARKKT